MWPSYTETTHAVQEQVPFYLREVLNQTQDDIQKQEITDGFHLQLHELESNLLLQDVNSWFEN